MIIYIYIYVLQESPFDWKPKQHRGLLLETREDVFICLTRPTLVSQICSNPKQPHWIWWNRSLSFTPLRLFQVDNELITTKFQAYRDFVDEIALYDYSTNSSRKFLQLTLQAQSPGWTLVEAQICPLCQMEWGWGATYLSFIISKWESQSWRDEMISC